MVPSQKMHEDSLASTPSSSSSSSSSSMSARRTSLRMRSLVVGLVNGFVMELAFLASNGLIQTMFAEEDEDSAASRGVDDHDVVVVDDAAGGASRFSLGGNSRAPAAVPSVSTTTMPLRETKRSTFINDISDYEYDYYDRILDSGSISSSSGDSSSGDGSHSLHDNLYGLYSDNLLLLFIILLWVALWRQHREHRREEVQLTKERQWRQKENHDSSDGMMMTTATTTTTPGDDCYPWWSAAMTSSTVWTLGLILGVVLAFGIVSGLPSALLGQDICVCWLSYLLGICVLVAGFMTAYEFQSIVVRQFFSVPSSDDKEDDDGETETELDLELTDNDEDEDEDETSCTSFADYAFDYSHVPLPGRQQQQHSEAKAGRYEGNGLANSYFLAQVV